VASGSPALFRFAQSPRFHYATGLMETTTPEIPALTPTKDERMMAMLCHIGALAGYVVGFGQIIVPLVIWLIKKDTMPFVNDQGKESLNFQITMFIAFVVAWMLCFVLIGLLILPVLGIAALVLGIVAGVKANDGVAYRYPFCIRFIK
jgi:uncharacterized Tic20 family protein